MEKQEVQAIAFQLIANAGEAFNCFYKAIDFAKAKQFEKANASMKEGEQFLHNAHNAQRDLLSAEANNEEIAFSVILIHAQDHLMNTILFERIAKEFIYLYKERM